ncbi:EF-hand [Xylariaceae sp. FL0804]|nr:EF-hand [Xylariaceae sp. FL0804]
MASTSSTASSLTRPRLAVTAISTVAAVFLGFYYYYYSYQQDELAEQEHLPAGAGLHRRNAVRRPRHASGRQDDSSESESHGDENVDTTALAPIRENTAPLDDPDGDEWYNDPSQGPRRGENIVTLLFRVSEDNARRNAYVHRGCQCNGCGMVPIRGIRYRCANCADFDLCEVCESQALHNKTHIFYKVRVPAPPFGPRHVQPAWYPGDPDNSIRSLPRPLLQKWSRETGFERVELDAFWEQWTFMANTEWRDDPNGLCLAMDRKTFERCLVPSGGCRHAAPNLIHDRMFAFYDTNHDDLIGFEEFLHGVSYRKRRDKLRKTFDGYDLDGDGYVSRRDFLRMFRAYYVLYKQFHRDILEGLDDHMMTTTEAQQLISGRQPLSSLFGREGRVPAADHGRAMEGKVFRSNGEVDVHDGKGVVNEDKTDTASREEILGGMFARNSTQSIFTESFGSSSRRRHSPDGDATYWSGVINPPRNTVDLSSLLNGDYAQLDDILDSIRRDGPPHALLSDHGEDSSDDEDADNQSNQSSVEEKDANEDGSASPVANADDHPDPDQEIPDAAQFASTLPTLDQLEAHRRLAMHADSQRLNMGKRKRIVARRRLLERWKRRQFYLDEEEGGLPPQGWNNSQDVLVSHLNGACESPKPVQQPLISPRSRSSSKVRFAEDTDEFETRSNASTTSRSVPERWGGMEIPDAERDAGKEILYQVTQQAFNELLDEIFKAKEDLAVRAAETKEDREKHRDLLDATDFSEEDNKSLQATPDEPQDVDVEEKAPVSGKSLDDLLSASGYTVDAPAPDGQVPESMEDQVEEDGQPESFEKEAPKDEATIPAVVDVASLERVVRRDPTMPQFMPDNISSAADAAYTNGDSAEIIPSLSSSQEFDRTAESRIVLPSAPEHVPHSTLLTWKRLDMAEQEARERGGWGRLSYDEFEEIYRDHEFQDSSRNRLDYLGSWIDFCIP